MEMITEAIATTNIFELLRVVWMEVAMASFAATIYFTFSGMLVPLKKVKAVKDPDQAEKFPRSQEPSTLQLVTKMLRQGRIQPAVALIQQLPDASSVYMSANLAPRLLMAVAKSHNFDEVMHEIGVFANKFEGRSFDAVVSEASRNKDATACCNLLKMSRMLSIPMSCASFETLAKVPSADAAYLRNLMKELDAPLPMSFAKALLETCTILKDADLASEIFEKVSESDEGALREVVERVAVAGSTKESSVHAKEIRTLGKSGDLPGAVSVFEARRQHSSTALMFNSIIDACIECGQVEKALEYFNLAVRDGIADVVTYNTAIKVHLNQGMVDVAEQLFKGLSGKSLTPTIASYHIMLNFHATAGDHLRVWKLVDEMQAAGIAPTTTTCAIMLKGKPNAGGIEKILSLADSLDADMDEIFFHSLAEACVHTGQLQILTTYHKRVANQRSSPALTAPTYGSMIKAFGQAREVKRVWDLWTDMIKHGVQPTAITLGCMIEALVVNRCTTSAWELVQQMRQDEATRPLVNTVIYSTILKGFANAKETDKVMSLYEEMKAINIQPNNITYNTILNAFAQGGAMDRVPALLTDMKNSNPPAEPDLVTYSTIVKGYCNAGSLQLALQVVEDMRSDGALMPDEVMYNSLLDGCAKEQRVAEATKLLDDMKRTGVKPSNYTLSILVKLMGRCRRLNQAFSIVENLSKEYGLKLNIQVYTCLIQACFNNRQAAKAVALHDQIIADGVTPDEMTYSVLVKGALKAGLVDKAVHLTKCAYGLGAAQFTGSPPGINNDNLDYVVHALGGRKSKDAMQLLDEIAQAQVANMAPQRHGKGSSKGRDSTPPWRR